MPDKTNNKRGIAYAIRYPELGVPNEEVGTFEEQANGDIRLTLTKLPRGGVVLLTSPQPK